MYVLMYYSFPQLSLAGYLFSMSSLAKLNKQINAGHLLNLLCSALFKYNFIEWYS